MTSGFSELGLRDELLASIDALGYTDPTPIQAEAIPHLLGGVDLVGQAATGTGKTAAFALPIINAIEKSGSRGPQALVLVPTRELAVQVAKAIREFGSEQGIYALAVFGGSPIYHQIKSLGRGVDIVVGTPGRTIDLLSRGALDLSTVATVVLDEADEMLDMGFAEDIEAIFDATPAERQTVLFSATMPPRIDAIAARHQNNPVRVRVSKADEQASKDLVRQTVYMVHPKDRAAALGRIIDVEAPESALVFCKTRQDVDDLTATMNARGYRAEALHGGMDQDQRDRVMARFRDGTADLLVATDVAARGLDVDALTHVVNYDVPTQAESYVHRIGRVGRAGRQGVAITLAEPRSRNRLRNIERLVGQKLEVSEVPSVEDLRSRQVAMTVAAITEQLAEDNSDFGTIVDQLAESAELRDVALAAIALAHATRNPVTDETFISPVAVSNDKRRDRDGGRDRNGRDSGRNGYGRDDRGRNDRGDRGRHDRSDRSPRSNGRQREDADTAMVYIGVGRRGQVRPGDLVGAIANETSLSGADIGPIRIAEHYSVVGVPPEALNEVVGAVNGASIRGRRAKARPYT